MLSAGERGRQTGRRAGLLRESISSHLSAAQLSFSCRSGSEPLSCSSKARGWPSFERGSP